LAGWLVLTLLAAFGSVLPTGCSPQNTLVDERNPYYAKGLGLLQKNRYADAAEAFEACLRLSPASAKAHLQLAMLCEDRLGDPARAIQHYRAYLAKAPTGDNADMARKWLARTERSYLQKLMQQYPDDVEILTNRGAPPGVPLGATPREMQLARRLKETSQQLADTREELRKVLEARPAGGAAAAGGAPALRPVVAAPAPVPLPAPLPPGPADAAVPADPLAAGGGEPPVNDGAIVEPAGGDTAAAPLPVPAAVPAVLPVPPPAAPAAAPAVKAAPAAAAAAPRTPAAMPEGRPFKPLWRLTPGKMTAAPASTSGGKASAGAVHHTVRPGDSLAGLARRYYGRSTAWPRIRDANPALRAGGALRPGMQVIIP